MENRYSEEELAASSSPSPSADLLVATMFIVGLPVDVHVKDGSVYSGIFHTASLDSNYAVVLKRARMIKKGNRGMNVTDGSVVETLIVLSEDLVQIVARGVSIPGGDISGDINGNEMGAITRTIPSVECVEMDAKMEKLSRCSTEYENGLPHFDPQENENGISDHTNFSKREEASADSTNVRWSRPQEKQSDHRQNPEFQHEQTISKLRGLNPVDGCDSRSNDVEDIREKTSLRASPNNVSSDNPAPLSDKIDDQSQEKQPLENLQSSDAHSSGSSTTAIPGVGITPKSCLNKSSASTELKPPKSSSCNIKTKESKLNPGAKTFFPSLVHQRLASPPAVPSVASVTFVPDPSPMVPMATAQPEVEISPFAPPSSVPVKFLPCNNIIVGNGGSDIQYSQPIAGSGGSRMQPVRYNGQLHQLQPGSAYVYPGSQNVMVGRYGQLFYVQPISHDVIQSASGISQVSTRPLFTPHQAHLAKHQGIATVQALQLCMTPPLLVSGQQSFAMANHFPISQTPLPALRPISVPGPHSFVGSKFA